MSWLVDDWLESVEPLQVLLLLNPSNTHVAFFLLDLLEALLVYTHSSVGLVVVAGLVETLLTTLQRIILNILLLILLFYLLVDNLLL